MLDLFFKIIILELDSSRRPSVEYLCFMCQSVVSFGWVRPACASQLTQLLPNKDAVYEPRGHSTAGLLAKNQKMSLILPCSAILRLHCILG